MLRRNNKNMSWKQTKLLRWYEQNPFARSAFESKPFCLFDFVRSKVRLAAREFCLLYLCVVFVSGLWEWMTNDTEGSTSRSPKLWERFDLSLLLTCAISLHTYSNSWLNPSLFTRHFFHLRAFAFSLFWSIFQDKDLLFTQKEPFRWHLVVWERNGYESHMTMYSIKAAWGASSRNGSAQKCTNACTQTSLLASPTLHKYWISSHKKLNFKSLWLWFSAKAHVSRKTSSSVLTAGQQVKIYFSFRREVYQYL